MRRPLAIAAATIILVGGGAAVYAAAPDGPPPSTGQMRRDRRPAPMAVLDHMLDQLVDGGTLTQEQADAVGNAFRQEWHKTRAQRREPGFAPARAMMGVAANTIGMPPEELTEALRDGHSVAEVATSHSVDPQAVVDALVTAGEGKLERAVADGRLTDEQAARLRQRLRGVAERFVHRARRDAPPGHPPPA